MKKIREEIEYFVGGVIEKTINGLIWFNFYWNRYGWEALFAIIAFLYCLGTLLTSII